eukprot:NODE_588_length_6359_cov_0.522843.p2 type:complete len:526 gc:universal NODE_588_length_6359_cov_0.522843:4105-5682(+)
MNLTSVLSGSIYLILLQFVSRVTTFVLNQLLLPHISPEVIGISMIQMEFLVNTILFFSREGIRTALFRSSVDNSSEKQKTLINISWLSAFVGLFTTLLMIVYFLVFSTDIQHYTTCVWIFGLSTWLELLIEPMFALTQAEFKFKSRVLIEGCAVFCNVLTSYILVMLGSTKVPSDNKYGVLAFAYARLSYSITLIFGYTILYSKVLYIFRPSKLLSNVYFDKSTLSLAWSFTKQSFVKQLLNEGDKFIMSMLATASTQGIWAIVLNYGSLFGRIIFAPLEEILRVLFSKLLLNARTSKEPEVKTNIDKSHKFILLFLRLHSILGILFICFASYFSYPVLHVIIGQEWAIKAGYTLSWFCYLIPLMGYNGVLEAFVSSVADQSELQIQSTWMAVCMTIYSITAYVALSLLEMGSMGIVIANACNFTLRILWCIMFTKKYYHDLGLHNLLLNRCFPNIITMVASLVTMLYLRMEFLNYYDNPSKSNSVDFILKHIPTGIAILSIVLASERAIFQDLRKILNEKSKKL